MNKPKISLFLIFLLMGLINHHNFAQISYIRINQCGYLPTDQKIATAFSDSRINGKFVVLDKQTDKELFSGKIEKANPDRWGNFNYYYLNFSSLARVGEYYIKILSDGTLSTSFSINTGAYEGYQEDVLEFMRQQRCGYNPFFDFVCHKSDGRIFYGTKPDSTYIDTSGGWHDAGDQLKYLITGSFATAFMILS
jgi:endoglucanase